MGPVVRYQGRGESIWPLWAFSEDLQHMTSVLWGVVLGRSKVQNPTTELTQRSPPFLPRSTFRLAVLDCHSCNLADLPVSGGSLCECEPEHNWTTIIPVLAQTRRALLRLPGHSRGALYNRHHLDMPPSLCKTRPVIRRHMIGDGISMAAAQAG